MTIYVLVLIVAASPSFSLGNFTSKEKCLAARASADAGNGAGAAPNWTLLCVQRGN